ncbi:hypothetical protein ACC738_38750, partial [Rhizobium ruizarguesonis]
RPSYVKAGKDLDPSMPQTAFVFYEEAETVRPVRMKLIADQAFGTERNHLGAFMFQRIRMLETAELPRRCGTCRYGQGNP